MVTIASQKTDLFVVQMRRLERDEGGMAGTGSSEGRARKVRLTGAATPPVQSSFAVVHSLRGGQTRLESDESGDGSATTVGREESHSEMNRLGLALAWVRFCARTHGRRAHPSLSKRLVLARVCVSTSRTRHIQLLTWLGVFQTVPPTRTTETVKPQSWTQTYL